MKKIAIAGAGLVGSLMSLYLVRRGYAVTLYERRPDFRKAGAYGGRSINLALSNRGLRALAEVGLADAMRTHALPMHGRMVHLLDGAGSFQAYGKEGQYINSISRSELNRVVLDAAEASGVKTRFSCKITSVDFSAPSFSLMTEVGAREDVYADLIIGADGAFSAVRGAMQTTDRFDYAQSYIEHGYKELTIPAGANGDFQLDPGALHIWPRERYMLIALPNPDKTFTCTLFFPFEGSPSFFELSDDGKISEFFRTVFPDAAALMPGLLEDYRSNPASSLVTVRCYPWVKDKTLLIGDAAHAIVPFYGQGMNAGFEDCRVLNGLLDQFADDWDQVLPAFQRMRKPDADAVSRLALDNFIEMRDLVADPAFILRKKIEGRLHAKFPGEWIPLYSMVTFHEEINYADAYNTGQRQKSVMDEVLAISGIADKWDTIDLENIMNRFREIR
ncbi:MAG: FAD-dependent oxidoreductase [Bacteroidota bacterium]